MRIILFFTLLFAFCLGGLTFSSYLRRKEAALKKADPNAPFIKNHPAYLQARTSHMLEFSIDEGKVHCTGTVVGPHAILTAEHCHPTVAFSTHLMIDNSQEKFKVLEEIGDKQEHVILFIDGAAFTEIEPFNTRVPVLGEKTYVYGFGKEVYPAIVKMGVVLDEYDPSEVDRRLGLFYASNHVVPGDSGSAVYGEDGSILGLVTFRFTADGEELVTGSRTESGHTGSFQLAFTPCQIRMAQTYTPKKSHKPRTAPKERKTIHAFIPEP